MPHGVLVVMTSFAALCLCIFSDCFNGKFHTGNPAKTEFL